MPQYLSREFFNRVPLDYEAPEGETIELFAREFYLPENKDGEVFVYLQGGPGYPSPRDPEEYEWMKGLLKDYRLLLLDQRGTGRSLKIGPELVEKYPTPEEQAEYFSHFRADNIVRDCEYLRENHYESRPWYLLGQSYGGFVATHYLSFYPQSLKGVLVTGGLPPLTASTVSNVYARLAERVNERNREFYEKYPANRDKVRRILDILLENPYEMGDGGVLTAHRFLDIGLMLGRTRGVDKLHYFLDDPFLDSSQSRLSWAFATKVCRQCSYETNPIYALLHESIYCDSRGSHWAADSLLKSHSTFDVERPAPSFHGENIRKAMFEEYAQLRRFKECANILAEKEDWPPLYDMDQLGQNEVPVECLVYKGDYYVDYEYSMETLEKIKGAQAWEHSTWQHDSLRVKGEEVIEGLLERLSARLGGVKGDMK